MIISLVYAMGGNPSTTGSTSGFGDWSFIIMIVVIFTMFYFLIIRPRRKKDELIVNKLARKRSLKKHSPFAHAFTTWVLILILGFIGLFVLALGFSEMGFLDQIGDSVTRILMIAYLLIIIILSFWGAYKVYRKYDSINKEMITAYKDPLTCLPDFEATQLIMGVDDLVGLAIDEERKKVCLINYASNQFHVISYKDILVAEVFEDGATISKTMRGSQIAGALIGNLVLGGAGAIIGGLSGKRKHEGTVSRIDVRLTINDTRQPIFDINFLNVETKKDNPAYQQALQTARHCHGLMEVLIKRADMEDKQKAQTTNLATVHQGNQQISFADELKKLSDLKDSGILTPEELEKQKTKLLNT